VTDTTKAVVVALIALLVPCLLVASWGSAAGSRLKESQAKPTKQTTAAVSDDSYCTPQLKAVVRRVAGACGLLQAAGGARGCQPMEAQKVAALSGGDFNALFQPLSKRAHILQVDQDKADLDDPGQKLADQAWSDQRGASFFFVVARASPDGDQEYNTALSRDRAQAVLKHLQEKFKDPDLEKQVGLLWLGEDFAQLGDEFCTWSRSHEACTPLDLNRSAFVAWIDCAI
jgi:outer membrane protein OmpA-like peptidoglycan-associated protein